MIKQNIGTFNNQNMLVKLRPINFFLLNPAQNFKSSFTNPSP
jgi:hypothetical protein